MKKKFSLVLLFVILLCSGCGTEPIEPVQQLVQIMVAGTTGRGVIYEKTEEYLIIVTAAHVLGEENCQATVRFSDGSTVDSASAYVSENSDVAFLKIALSDLALSQNFGKFKKVEEKFVTVPVDKESYDALQSGDVIRFHEMGNIEEAALVSGSLLESWIYVEDFEQYMMLIQGNIYAGMSGGGVFDENGNFIGILCGANDVGEVAVVPLSIIQAEYLQFMP